MQLRIGVYSGCSFSSSHHPGCRVLCRNSLGNGKGRNTANKISVRWHGHAEDMDLDTMPARSNTATPGPSDDDMQSKLSVLYLWVT